jgi:hypothetical protein
MIPLLNLHELHERKFQAERAAFVRRHNPVSVPWLMFCIGFTLGVGLMLLSF